MSEPNETFPFREEDGSGIDFDAIFGSGGTVPAAPPIPAVPQSTAVSETQAPEKPANAPDLPNTAEPDLFTVFSGASADPPGAAQAEEKPAASTQVSLFDKPPVFSYGGAKENIEDTAMTFEELRIKKAEDFPELEDGKKVSWTVKYGDITKAIPAPKDTTIAKIKEEIEKSKAFLDALKKGKVKDPVCLVTPKVTAGSKGIATYKGVYPTVEAARRSDKPICLIPARDGRIYEMRKTELGECIVPKSKVVDFAEIRAGFMPALPRIPRTLMGQLIAFFRSFMDDDGEREALAFIYWDRQEQRFTAYIPKQTTSKAHIGFALEDDAFPEERYLHYADIHSHNSMAARFSIVDDADEKATRLYIVVGHLDRLYPEIAVRFSCGGTYLEVPPESVIEGLDKSFPPEWRERVSAEKYADAPETCHATALEALEVTSPCDFL